MAAPLPAARAPVGLEGRLDDLLASALALWRRSPATLPALGRRTTLWQRLRAGRATRRLVDELAGELVHAPQEPVAQAAWRDSVRARLQRFGEERLGWPASYRRLVFGEEFSSAAMAFAREARAVDRELGALDLFQALRNVWIGNSLQMLLDLPARLTPGLFAYSMLYPLTDNLLDDPRVTAAAKRDFNDRLGRRLAGLAVSPHDLAEARVFAMVTRIEAQLPRDRFPDVYASLLAIHHAQTASLRQQRPEPLDDEALASLSFAKGGASVLADLYLVKPAPALLDERFAFGYGCFLQLLDDLQDVREDLAAGHQTLFTRAVARGPLDAPTAALARFIDRVLDDGPGASTERADLVDLVRRNCRALLVGAVAEQPHLFTPRFRRAITATAPVGLGAMRRLRRRAQERFEAATTLLASTRGVRSALDLLAPRSHGE
jgi:hypothetical protein